MVKFFTRVIRRNNTILLWVPALKAASTFPAQKHVDVKYYGKVQSFKCSNTRCQDYLRAWPIIYDTIISKRTLHRVSIVCGKYLLIVLLAPSNSDNNVIMFSNLTPPTAYTPRYYGQTRTNKTSAASRKRVTNACTRTSAMQDTIT